MKKYTTDEEEIMTGIAAGFGAGLVFVIIVLLIAAVVLALR